MNRNNPDLFVIPEFRSWAVFHLDNSDASESHKEGQTLSEASTILYKPEILQKAQNQTTRSIFHIIALSRGSLNSLCFGSAG